MSDRLQNSFTLLTHMPHPNDDTDAGAEGETKQELKEWQSIEDITKTDAPTSSESSEEVTDVLHIIRDVIHVCVYLFMHEHKRLIFCPAHTYKN